MVGHAVSQALKKRKSRAGLTQRLNNAAAAYIQERQNSQRPRGLRVFADMWNVSTTSLARRVSGKRTQEEYIASLQRLSPVKEQVLVDFILQSADRGFPLNRDQIMEYANAIVQEIEGEGCEMLGEKWIEGFNERHATVLQTHWSRPLDTQRGRALNHENTRAWFELIKTHIVDEEILPENIYGMDESGFTRSHSGKERVYGRRGTKTQHKQGGADRENVTALVTICADGTALRPMIIFKGKHFMAKWNNNNVAHSTISHSPNGWTDGELAFDWIKLHFDPLTREKANGRTRVLLLDGHKSHYTRELLHYAIENNIKILGYPPHCTHALQGLDVVCFAKMKEIWKEELNLYEKRNQKPLSKADFAYVFGTAFLRAFTSDTIHAAFSATGVYPFNDNVISERQIQPSIPTSTKGTFPLPQPSPIRRVMAVFRNNSPSASNEANHDPITSSPIRRPASPTDFTPRKRARMISESLLSSSASYLVSNSPIKSTHQIFRPVLEHPSALPEPDWSLLDPSTMMHNHDQSRTELEERVADLEASLDRAQKHIMVRNLIIESNQAQMVVQDLVLHQQNRTLQARENKKKEDRVVLFPSGKGRVLTDEAFSGEIEQLTERIEREEQEKQARAKERERKRALKEAFEVRWQAAKKECEEKRARHQKLIEQLISDRIPRKDYPKAPKCLTRAEVQAIVEQELDYGEGEGSEDDNGMEEVD